MSRRNRRWRLWPDSAGIDDVAATDAALVHARDEWILGGRVAGRGEDGAAGEDLHGRRAAVVLNGLRSGSPWMPPGQLEPVLSSHGAWMKFASPRLVTWAPSGGGEGMVSDNRRLLTRSVLLGKVARMGGGGPGQDVVVEQDVSLRRAAGERVAGGQIIDVVAGGAVAEAVGGGIWSAGKDIVVGKGVIDEGDVAVEVEDGAAEAFAGLGAVLSGASLSGVESEGGIDDEESAFGAAEGHVEDGAAEASAAARAAAAVLTDGGAWPPPKPPRPGSAPVELP